MSRDLFPWHQGSGVVGSRSDGASATSSSRRFDAGEADGLLEELAQLLGIQTADELEQLRSKIEAMAQSAFVDSWLVGRSASAAVRPAMRELCKHLAAAWVASRSMSPDVVVALQTFTGQTEHWQDSLWRLLEAVDEFDQAYAPPRRRPPDIALERVVRTFLPFAEERAGRAMLTMNKNTGGSPALSSVSANAVGWVVRALLPGVTTTAVANMIMKVRDRPNETLSDEDYLIRMTLGSELDASLLPGRRTTTKSVDSEDT